jgi:CheY-like chemotaxis protein
MLSRYLGDHPILSLADQAPLDACVEQEHPAAIILNQPPQAEAANWLGPLSALTSRYNLPIIRCSIPSHTWLTQATGLDGVLTKPVSQQALRVEIEQRVRPGATLLIVDNNPGFVSLMVRMVENLEGNYRLLTAYSGEDALRLAREQRPDLVLLDLLMPEPDGFQVAAMLREDSRLAAVPIVAVTATSYAEESLQQRGSHLTCFQAEGLSAGQAANILAALLRELQPNYLPASTPSRA